MALYIISSWFAWERATRSYSAKCSNAIFDRTFRGLMKFDISNVNNLITIRDLLTTTIITI